MKKATLAKILGWGQAVLLYAQQVISTQSALPHGLAAWAQLIGSILLGAAVHHASNTGGSN